MPLIARQYRDISLAFAIHPIRKDINVLTGADAINQSLENLILTNHYEIPFHSEVGSGIPALLFENFDPITAATAKRSIEETIKNFEPRVSLVSVDVIAMPDQHALGIRIVYFINNVSDPIVFTTILERTR